MQYRELLSRTQTLRFIPDADTADAAIKAVAGMLASRLDEAHAALLANRIPEPLSFEELRGNQQSQQTAIDVERGLNTLNGQFGLEHRQSEELLKTVLDWLTEGMDPESLGEIREGLPEDWNRLLTIH